MPLKSALAVHPDEAAEIDALSQRADEAEGDLAAENDADGRLMRPSWGGGGRPRSGTDRGGDEGCLRRRGV